MRTIWKYKLQITDSQIIMLPKNSEILTVQFQEETLCLWAIVSPDEKLVEREILIIGTGHLVKTSALRYINTCQQFNGNLIWHIFERY